MTEPNEPEPVIPQSESVPPPYGEATPVPAPAAPAAAYGAHAGAAPIGQVRSTGTCVLLTIVTLGFYTWYWYYKTHDEMKQHTGQGIGGGVALILAILVGIVMPFLNSSEVGKLYERRGQKPPVGAATGLWFLLLGWFFFVGAIVWFIKTNGALNDYWRSVGAEG
jgi:quinol-cytochrome oxidoreductase complex cytochrome b subunit